MQRTFFGAIALSAVIVWWHLFFDLRGVLPDSVARLTVALAFFILFIGLIYWIVQKGEDEKKA
ncbi:hypothetical protein BBI11_15750 [Planococcus maritimus]|uniref:hypothetical protein n=1 Tax=Planococcus maritimus TaxID=192421 RepID=UPI00080F019E|nr:hypothetical protein [Planococcus maritimus]ANU18402.1 hypothetical protein BBI11_15750 [Planococcus maritimus]